MHNELKLESSVRSYCRKYPDQFSTGSGTKLTSSGGREFLDFLSGCGALNYGHNPEVLRDALVRYIEKRGVVMSMDLHTEAKEKFMEAFQQLILSPRNLEFKLQFPGPTGANAVEAAIKLARKVTNRTNVIAFTNGFHGCSLGALALTSTKLHRSHSASLLTNVTRMPYEGFFGNDQDTANFLEKMLSDPSSGCDADPSSGCDAPAAIVFEAVQGEGGLNSASTSWAKRICEIARMYGALVILDDIQAGCGRTGNFFSFEALGITPDIICLAKSISGFGLPMALVLIRPDIDLWSPGEHNGTFRGNNYAFVTATKALETFWAGDFFAHEIRTKAEWLKNGLVSLSRPLGLTVKGRGMMLGVDVSNPTIAEEVRATCYEHGLIIETCGAYDNVLKMLPPLTASKDEIDAALKILETAFGRENIFSSITANAIQPRLGEVTYV